MKKILALFLALCLMLAALPVVAENDFSGTWYLLLAGMTCGTFELNADGSFTGESGADEEIQKTEGTWSADGDQVTLTVVYDRESLTVLQQGHSVKDTVYGVAKTGKPYGGTVTSDPYGRPQPKPAHGTGNLDHWTSSTRAIMKTMMELYDRITDPDLLVRRVYIAACGLIPEKEIPAEAPMQLDLFTDYAELEKRKNEEQAAEARERKLQEATLVMQERFGKNAVLKGMNLEKKGTTIARNGQIGGHRAGIEEKPARKKGNQP